MIAMINAMGRIPHALSTSGRRNHAGRWSRHHWVVDAVLMGATLLCFAAVTPSTLPALYPTLIRYGSLAIVFNVFVSANANRTLQFG